MRKGSAGWKVAQVHQRLGNPTTATLVRMQSLAISLTWPPVISYKCPVCTTVAPPDRYPKANPNPRPTAFGKEVHVDLKCLHDRGQKLHVALSIVDAVTSFHVVNE